MTTPACARCRFFHSFATRDKPDEKWGQCRYGAPATVNGWPRVTVDQWCGRFREKEGAGK